jgi:hypothetical protein
MIRGSSARQARRRYRLGLLPLFILTLTSAGSALAADAAPMGTPPSDGKALVEAPKAGPDAPKVKDKVDGTTVSASAGGMLTTGNSRLLALSGSAVYEKRFDVHGIGASLLGNYGEGAPPGNAVVVTAENLQGKLRYDFYLKPELALFILNTGRHDRLQGIDFRYNLDPGVKYIVWDASTTTLWGEVGYDLQHTIRRDQDRVITDADGNPVIDVTTGLVELIPKTQTDHSIRAFIGYKHAFNKEVTLSTGAEYLQSVIDSDRYRVNVDALFAAKIVGGLAVGFGFSARYDHQPLAGKEKLDTASTLSLIYAFSNVKEPPKAPACSPEGSPDGTELPLPPPEPDPPVPPPPPADQPFPG